MEYYAESLFFTAENVHNFLGSLFYEVMIDAYIDPTYLPDPTKETSVLSIEIEVRIDVHPLVLLEEAM